MFGTGTDAIQVVLGKATGGGGLKGWTAPVVDL